MVGKYRLKVFSSMSSRKSVAKTILVPNLRLLGCKARIVDSALGPFLSAFPTGKNYFNGIIISIVDFHHVHKVDTQGKVNIAMID